MGYGTDQLMGCCLHADLGRYVDLGVLGEGGMGEVRKVRDEILNRNLAMKIVHPSMLLNSKALARFFEEAQIGAQLQHPNIIPVHEFGELPDGRLYFTMKEIKGTEFSKCIREVHQASTDDTWLEGKEWLYLSAVDPNLSQGL